MHVQQNTVLRHKKMVPVQQKMVPVRDYGACLAEYGTCATEGDACAAECGAGAPEFGACAADDGACASAAASLCLGPLAKALPAARAIHRGSCVQPNGMSEVDQKLHR